ncbi:hypothetical protein B0H13DRAFT_1874056 [Mycena leptocephala]|nr:hypothetical protein B0H13DRAFT_1874056 [Mycena leptocephala]
MEKTHLSILYTRVCTAVVRVHEGSTNPPARGKIAQTCNICPKSLYHTEAVGCTTRTGGPRQGAWKCIEYKCKNCYTQSGADAAEQQAYRDSCKVHSVPGVPGQPAAGTRVQPPQVAARVPLPQPNFPLHAAAPNPPLQQPQLGRGRGVPVSRGRGRAPAARDRHRPLAQPMAQDWVNQRQVVLREKGPDLKA